MRELNVLIVDDEENNRQLLQRTLSKKCPFIKKFFEASSASLAIEMLKSHPIDIVFLDVEMPGGNGFEVLNAFEKPDFQVIFITAYDEYAIRAIKYSALDYLLKPVDPDELADAVDKVQKMDVPRDQMDLLKTNLKDKESQRIVFTTAEAISFFSSDEIIRLEADANYTKVMTTNEPELLVSGNIGHYAGRLEGHTFLRTHQSHLINRNHIRKWVTTDGGYLLMSDGSQVPVSRLKKEQIKRMITAS